MSAAALGECESPVRGGLEAALALAVDPEALSVALVGVVADHAERGRGGDVAEDDVDVLGAGELEAGMGIVGVNQPVYMPPMTMPPPRPAGQRLPL